MMNQGIQKKCHMSFEMTSEDMLEIGHQPADTCDFNHPLHNDMDYTFNDLRVAVADAPYNITTVRSLSYDHNNIQNLQDAIDDFSYWQEGWIDTYTRNILPHINEQQREQFNQAINKIEESIESLGGFYHNLDVESTLSEMESNATRIEHSIENAFHSYNKHNEEIESQKTQLEYLQNSLDSCDNEEEITQVEEEISAIETEIETLEANEPWQEHVDDATSELDNYENTYSCFGNPMQNHYTGVRAAISEFKTITKHFLEQLSNDKVIDNMLSYPEDHLSELMADHSKNDVTITAATEDNFIKRVQEIEKDSPSLDEEDREILLDAHDSNEALRVAMKRFKKDYPQYQRLLCFDSKQDAITLGKRSFHSLDAETLILQNKFHENDVGLAPY